MQEKPILFNTDMVRAILDGRKTQTRRVLQPQPKGGAERTVCGVYVNEDGNALICRHGMKGDRLWVRETWRDVNLEGAPGILYRADWYQRDLMDEDEYLCSDGSMNYEHPHIAKYDWSVWHADVGCGEQGHGWRPSIHMPRWASRITLEITSVRVERLQDISEQDAIAEGAQKAVKFTDGYISGEQRIVEREDNACHGFGFEGLWKQMNGLESWESNPWVWVIDFEMVDDNA